MTTRYNINDFALANPAYVGGTVSFYTVSGGAKTSTLATLYAASTGSTELSNPRTLDSDGKFSVPVYVEAPVIATVSGLTIADHDTGIMGLAESAAATSAAAAAVSAAAALVSEGNASASEDAAAASAASITLPLPVASGGTGSGNASAARTALGVAIGSDVQAYDGTLASLAGLTLTQGALLTATGADAGAVLAKGTALQQLRMNAGATAPEWFTPAPIFSASYDSGNQTISNAGLLTLAHGLGVAPKIVQFFAKCLTGEYNWTAGAMIPVSGAGPQFSGAGATANGFVADVSGATNITVRFGALANPITALDATTGALNELTSANWALVVRAYA